MSRDTLIILDWDDTLFPTTWINKNNINIGNELIRNKLTIYLNDLDTKLYKLLTKLMTCGFVVIITNAATEWVYLSSSVLPKSYKLIKDKIDVVSARNCYQTKFPDNMYKWKLASFKDVYNKIILRQQ